MPATSSMVIRPSSCRSKICSARPAVQMPTATTAAQASA